MEFVGLSNFGSLTHHWPLGSQWDEFRSISRRGLVTAPAWNKSKKGGE